MTSRNKMKKARNSYCCSALKFGQDNMKRVYFYDSAKRNALKKKVKDYIKQLALKKKVKDYIKQLD